MRCQGFTWRYYDRINNCSAPICIYVNFRAPTRESGGRDSGINKGNARTSPSRAHDPLAPTHSLSWRHTSKRVTLSLPRSSLWVATLCTVAAIYNKLVWYSNWAFSLLVHPAPCKVYFGHRRKDSDLVIGRRRAGRADCAHSAALPRVADMWRHTGEMTRKLYVSPHERSFFFCCQSALPNPALQIFLGPETPPTSA